jgi:L-ascorbate metabolism protein UlaG (beta-lactamase superfamily)
MHEQHLGPEAALQAMKDLGAASMIPMHFGTFPNGDDAETEPVEILEAAIAASPDLVSRVNILDNGQSVDIAPATPRDLPLDWTLEASVLSGAP